MKCVRSSSIPILAAAILLSSCSASMPPSPAPGPSALLLASCPNLTPLADDGFGATTIKLVEVATTYNECRCAAGLKTPACP